MIHNAREYIDILKYEAHRNLSTKEGYQWININYENNSLEPINGSKLHYKSKLINPIIESIVSGKTVLDIGCDKGYFSWFSCKSGASNVYANEIHPKVHNFTKALFKYMKLNITPICNNLFLENIKIEVDYVFAFAVIHQIENNTMEDSISKIRGFCKEGALIEFCGDYRMRLGSELNLINFESIISKYFNSIQCVVNYEAINGDNPRNLGTRYIYDCRCN